MSDAAKTKEAEAFGSAAPPAYDMDLNASAPGYPPMGAGYPPQQPGYPQAQQPGYPPQQPGYPPAGAPGYPPQQPGYPPAGAGYPPQGPSAHPPSYDQASYDAKPPEYGTATDIKDVPPGGQLPQYNDNMMPPAMGDLVWGMEPSADELNAELGGNTGKGLFQVITGTNTVRCAACNQNCMWRENHVKFVKCPKCQVWTHRKEAKPLEAGLEFVHCDGNCGHQLLLVPTGTQQFMCPRERRPCRPLPKK